MMRSADDHRRAQPIPVAPPHRRESRYSAGRRDFEADSRELRFPLVIHTDNGVPFASRAPGGLSRLSMRRPRGCDATRDA
jgi:hypothetical protein